MAVKIRLKRLGKIRVPQYRIVVVDSRKKRDGRVIEEIGKYHPKEDPSYIDVVSDRAQYWLGVGAQPTEAVEVLLKITGDWQKFKGEPGAEGTLRVAEPKQDKLARFNEALKDAQSAPKEAIAPKAAEKAEPKADKAEEKAEPKAEEKAEEKPAAEAASEEPTEAKGDEAETPAEA
ncbi:30S ribosomal protein S16 [Nocardioides limicola]|uniref:30S ribosomal protein S16 n=1 Tax=Nocardioides limicola TaxID=2803368 RepID=UPI00193B4401|nr:30S ribosomal protein S16 [Nocardioides sp. DJM-14]